MQKQHKSLLSGLRPQIQKILQVEECLKYFKEFCLKSCVRESLDCILEIIEFQKVEEGNHSRLECLFASYLLEESSRPVNIDSCMRNNILQYKGVSSEQFHESYNEINQHLCAIRDELIATLSFRIAHFVESTYWQEFSSNHANLVPACLTETDQQTWEKIRYRKEDFERDRLSEKEVLLCEFMKDDQSIFKLQKSVLNGCLSVYTCDGSILLDEKDIGLGKFQGFKVAGSLPYPSWLIILALASSKFHADIWEGYRFDREFDFKHIPASQENGQTYYDTHIAKLIVRYGKYLDHRSCYCMTENLYKGNRTYMISKSITPHDGKYKANYFESDLNKDIFGEYERHNTDLTDVNSKINMKGRKKCVHMPLISLFSIQPLNQNQSLFSYSNLANPGGFLLSKLGTPQKRLMEIASSYRENILKGIKKLLENDAYLLKRMGFVYQTVQTRLNRYKVASKTKEPHIFEPTFEEQLQKLVKFKGI